jgi:hypothetical protein
VSDISIGTGMPLLIRGITLRRQDMMIVAYSVFLFEESKLNLVLGYDCFLLAVEQVLWYSKSGGLYYDPPRKGVYS